MRRAVINESGEVENVIEADDSFVLPGKRIVDAGDAGPGWLEDENGVLVPPPDLEPVIKEPSELEVRLAALEKKAGITEADKEAARTALKNVT